MMDSNLLAMASTLVAMASNLNPNCQSVEPILNFFRELGVGVGLGARNCLHSAVLLQICSPIGPEISSTQPSA